MPARHQQRPPLRSGLRWMAAALGVALVGAAGSAILAGAGSATAATPVPTYHAGSDTATFTATGVLDSNCLVSTGGTEVWIRPGDIINFKSSAAGISLGGLGLTTGAIAGLNVTAAIDATTTSAGQSVSVSAGHTTVFPKAGQHTLSAGDHKLTWTAKSATVAPLLGPLITVPLSSSSLSSGASLSWTGVIHVTTDAPQCKLSVSTPKAAISVGPIKVTVPPINVGVRLPTLPNLPALPKLPGLPGGKTTTAGGHTAKPGSIHYTPPPLTVPEQAMGGIGGSGGGFQGVLPDGGSSTRLGTNLPDVSGTEPAKSQSSAKSGTKVKPVTKRIDLAANKAPAAQLPVLLAIIAIIALALVTATYARLYLLRRNS